MSSDKEEIGEEVEIEPSAIEEFVDQDPQYTKIVTPVGDITYWAKWVGNFFVIVGVLMTGANLYPWNIIPAIIGNVLWGYVGAIWNDRAMVVLQAFLCGVLMMSFTEYIKGVM